MSDLHSPEGGFQWLSGERKWHQELERKNPWNEMLTGKNIAKTLRILWNYHETNRPSKGQRKSSKRSFESHLDLSGQIIIFHQPRFPWNKGISLTKPPFGVRSCEVAIICPDDTSQLLGLCFTCLRRRLGFFNKKRGNELSWLRNIARVCHNKAWQRWSYWFKLEPYPGCNLTSSCNAFTFKIHVLLCQIQNSSL